MPNFFDDNPDLRFYVDSEEMRQAVGSREGDFSDQATYPHAPENVDDAMDSGRLVLQVCGEIAGEFIEPRAESVDLEGAQLKDGTVTYATGMREALERLRQADLMGFTLPRKYGGLNLPTPLYVAANEIISRADASLSNLFGLQDIAETILDFGDDALKDEYLPKFASGEVTGAMVLTEPDAGSDLQAVRLQAEELEDGSWALNGVKRFITNGCGDVLLVLARSEPGTVDGRGLSLFVCEKGPKVVVRRLEDKLGIHGSPTCELQFKAAPARLVGQRRRGLTRYVMALMNGARLGIAAQALGIAEAAQREALSYARDRQQFGRPIIEFPAVYELLTNMKVRLAAARALTYDTAFVVEAARQLAHRIETGQVEGDELTAARAEQKGLSRLAAVLTPMCKYLATEAANQIADDAIQVLGGSGYMRDYPVERHFRDARITNIYEGTTQLQVVAAVGGLLGKSLDPRLAEFQDESFDKPLAGLAHRVAKCRPKLEKAVAYVRSKGQEYTDFHARRLVDVAMDIYVSYLLLRGAKRDRHRTLLAKKFIHDMLPQLDANVKMICSGDKTTIRDHGKILEL